MQTAVGIGGGQVEIDGNGTFATIADTGEPRQGHRPRGAGGFARTAWAPTTWPSTGQGRGQGWRLGDRVPVRYVDGTAVQARIGAIYDANDIAGSYVLPRSSVAAHTPQLQDFAGPDRPEAGVSLEEGRARSRRSATGTRGPRCEDRDQYTNSVAAGIDQILGIILIMLASWR